MTHHGARAGGAAMVIDTMRSLGFMIGFSTFHGVVPSLSGAH
jgi:hypothetical protein